MVEITTCFITKYGSLHKTEEDAEQAEMGEESENFSDEFAESVVAMCPTGKDYNEYREVGFKIWQYIDLVKKLIAKYNL